MYLATLIAITFIDSITHRIPHRLVALLPFLAFPVFNVKAFVILTSIFFAIYVLSDLGAGDLKLASLASIGLSHFTFERFLLVFTLSAMASLFLWRREARIPLAPAISIALASNL